MQVTRFRVAILGGAVALSLTACGSAPGPGRSTSSLTDGSGQAGSRSQAGGINACMVLDTGGIADKSYNESSYAGMTAAVKANPALDISYVPSASGNDYAPNLDAEVGHRCDPIIGVGGLMQEQVEKVAAANPSLHFAEVDAPSARSNVYGLQFNTAQGAFLGGYLAAGMTRTGKVATWGGVQIPGVTVYMDGFWEGVRYYNEHNGTNVQVLGWNEKDQQGGTFSNSFTDQNKGEQLSQTFIQQGADIIFPVAGGAGLGAAAAAQASGGQANVIWVDTDGCVSAAQYCRFFITSVTKNLARSVTTYLRQYSDGHYPTGSYIGTLANDGTGLAPYHDFAGKVPAALTAQLGEVKAGIVAGTIRITSPSQPKA